VIPGFLSALIFFTFSFNFFEFGWSGRFVRVFFVLDSSPMVLRARMCVCVCVCVCKGGRFSSSSSSSFFFFGGDTLFSLFFPSPLSSRGQKRERERERKKRGENGIDRKKTKK